MALTGNCSNTTYTDHETDTETVTVTLPDGTSSSSEVPVLVPSTTNYTGVYLCITQIDNFSNWYASEDETQETLKDMAFIVYYSVYTNQRTRDLDKFNSLFDGNFVLQNYNHTENLYSQAYTQIKLIEGLTNLTDA